MRIDLALLTRLDACAAHSNAFAAAFPDGLTVTGEPNADAIARIVAAGLDVGWFCGMVLTAPALAAYREATATDDAAYREVTATAAWRLLTSTDNILPEYRQ